MRSLVARGEGEVLTERAGLGDGELDELLQGPPPVFSGPVVAGWCMQFPLLLWPPPPSWRASCFPLEKVAHRVQPQRSFTTWPRKLRVSQLRPCYPVSTTTRCGKKRTDAPSSPPGGSLPLPGTPNVYYLAKAQLATWVDSTGTGRCTFTPSRTAFISSADQATWESEGRPGLGYTGISIGGQDAVPPNLEGTNALYLCPNGPSSTNAQVGTSGEWVENGAPLQLFNVSGLPTDSARFGTLITQRQIGIEAIDSEPPGEFNTFAAVVQLLSGPDLGADPRLQISAVSSASKSSRSNGHRFGNRCKGPNRGRDCTSYFISIFPRHRIIRREGDRGPGHYRVPHWSVDDLGPSTNTTASAYDWAITYEPGTVYSFSLVSSGIVDSDSATAR